MGSPLICINIRNTEEAVWGSQYSPKLLYWWRLIVLWSVWWPRGVLWPEYCLCGVSFFYYPTISILYESYYYWEVVFSWDLLGNIRWQLYALSVQEDTWVAIPAWPWAPIPNLRLIIITVYPSWWYWTPSIVSSYHHQSSGHSRGQFPTLGPLMGLPMSHVQFKKLPFSLELSLILHVSFKKTKFCRSDLITALCHVLYSFLRVDGLYVAYHISEMTLSPRRF